MQSAASGLIEAFKNEFGGEVADWDRIAYDMYLYGAGGILCWGTLCGVPNGCVAVLNLLGLHVALGGEVLGYYSGTKFPTSQLCALYEDPHYGSGGTGGYVWTWEPVPDEEVLAHTTSHSPLCHVSISKWCYAAGVDLGVCPWEEEGWPSSAKNDRCGKICADMAAYTAALINFYAQNGSVEAPYQIPADTADCMDCHFKAGNPPGSPAQCGKMDCQECHGDGSQATLHSGRSFVLQKLWTEAWDAGEGEWYPATEFSPGDWIRYCVRFQILAPGALWVQTRPKYCTAWYAGGPGYTAFSFVQDGSDCHDNNTWRSDGNDKVPLGASGPAAFGLQLWLGESSRGPWIYQTPIEIDYFNVS